MFESWGYQGFRRRPTLSASQRSVVSPCKALRWRVSFDVGLYALLSVRGPFRHHKSAHTTGPPCKPCTQIISDLVAQCCPFALFLVLGSLSSHQPQQEGTLIILFITCFLGYQAEAEMLAPRHRLSRRSTKFTSTRLQ